MRHVNGRHAECNGLDMRRLSVSFGGLLAVVLASAQRAEAAPMPAPTTHAVPTAPAAPAHRASPAPRPAAPRPATAPRADKRIVRIAPDAKATFASLQARVAAATDPKAAGDVGHALAKEIRTLLPAYFTLLAKDKGAAEATYRPLLDASSGAVSAAFQHATKSDPHVSAALLAPVARALDEGGSQHMAQILFRRIESNEAAPPADRAFALARVADAFVSDVRGWQKEPLAPFEQAVLQIRGAPSWAGALGQAAMRLEMAAGLEPDPARKQELLARSKVLEGEVASALAPPVKPPVVDIRALSSRDRRLLQALVELKRRGYDVAIDRASDPGQFYFVPPEDGEKQLAIGYGSGDGLHVPASADEVLRHEVQHLYDWSQGKLGKRSEATARSEARAELRANYAATKDVSKAIAMTRALHPATAQEIDGLRAQIEAEGGRADLDRAVFARSMKAWRELRGTADPGPEGGPVRADASPLAPPAP